MNETQLWHAYCEDIDCVGCARGKVIAVTTPLDWEASKVVRYLQAQGYLCTEGYMIDYVQEEDFYADRNVTADPNWK